MNELLDRGIFNTRGEVMLLVKHRRREYNQVHPHKAKKNRSQTSKELFKEVSLIGEKCFRFA